MRAMEAEIHNNVVDENGQREVFAEVSLFSADIAGSDESGDCGCYSCDGNPCIK